LKTKKTTLKAKRFFEVNFFFLSGCFFPEIKERQLQIAPAAEKGEVRT
jgi:hypothetical protein